MYDTVSVIAVVVVYYCCCLLFSTYLIDRGFVHNILGPTGITQGAQCLPVTGLSRGNSCQDKHTITTHTHTQRVLTHSLATMMVLELPPRLSLSNHVNTESRYGMNTFLFLLPEPPDMSAGEGRAKILVYFDVY